MKKNLLLLCLSAAIFLIPCLRLSAQSDKEILKTATDNMKKKDCKSAFYLLITAKHTKKKKIQTALRKAYPCLVSNNTKEANKIKISDSADASIIISQLNQIVYFLKDNNKADSLFKIFVTPTTYKTYSKYKKNEKTLTAYENRIAAVEKKAAEQAQAIIEKQKAEKAREDSISAARADSIAKSKEIKKPVASADTVVTKVSPYVKKYYIIQGSYKTAEEAAAVVSKLKASGYASETTGPNAYGNIRVSYNSYVNIADAQKELIVIRKTQQDAWIHEK